MLTIFLHIPKTGGTNVAHAIAKACTRGTEFVQLDNRIPGTFDEISALFDSGVGANRLKYLLGHQAFGAHSLAGGVVCRYVTMIREPLQRLVSDYSRLGTMPWGDDVPELSERELETWCEGYGVPRSVSFLDFIGWRCNQDLMTRLLSGNSAPIEPGEAVPRIEVALSNLARCTWYDITVPAEFFLEPIGSADPLGHWLATEAFPQLGDAEFRGRMNRSKWPTVPSEEDVAAFLRLNQNDVRLYGLCRRM